MNKKYTAFSEDYATRIVKVELPSGVVAHMVEQQAKELAQEGKIEKLDSCAVYVPKGKKLERANAYSGV